MKEEDINNEEIQIPQEQEEEKKTEVQPNTEASPDTQEQTKEETPVTEGQPSSETQQPEKTIEPTNRQKLHEMLSGMLDGYNPDDEEGSSAVVMEYLSRNNDQMKKLSEALAKDPKLAQLLSDVVSGKRSSAGALARYFGKDFLSAEEGTPEYDEIMKAEEERKNEIESRQASQKIYQENLDSSMPKYIEACKKDGTDPDGELKWVWENYIGPVLNGQLDGKFHELSKKMQFYDIDISDAMKAGEVKGRNTNIQKIKENRGDGLPKGMNSQAVSMPKAKPRPKGILELANEA